MTKNPDWNINKFSCCPYCGGKVGFRISKIVRHYEIIGWNSEVSHVDGELIKSNKLMLCEECKKPVGYVKDLDINKIYG